MINLLEMGFFPMQIQENISGTKGKTNQDSK